MTAAPPPVAVESRRGGRIAGLDGVRGLAILIVVVEHAGVVRPRAGGLGGVTIFFVLSGFLITRLLLREYDRTGRIVLPMFWLRRGVRLLPALWVFLVVVGVAFTALNWVEPGRPPWSLSIPVLFYYANYAQLFGPLDYLSQTWSLAVEEQFYVVWPFLVLAMLRFIPRRLIAWLFLLLLVSGVVIRVHIGQTDPDPLELTRTLQANYWPLALGATLAAVLERMPRIPRISGTTAALVAVVGLDLLPRVLELEHRTWYGVTTSPFLFGLVGAVLLVSGLTAHRSWLTFPVLTWMGRRSYAWYLWHFAFVWASVKGFWHWHGGTVDGLLGGLLGLGAAELSWQLVEHPVNTWFRRWLGRRRLPAGHDDERPHPAVDARLAPVGRDG